MSRPSIYVPPLPPRPFLTICLLLLTHLNPVTAIPVHGGGSSGGSSSSSSSSQCTNRHGVPCWTNAQIAGLFIGAFGGVGLYIALIAWCNKILIPIYKLLGKEPPVWLLNWRNKGNKDEARLDDDDDDDDDKIVNEDEAETEQPQQGHKKDDQDWDQTRSINTPTSSVDDFTR